MGPVAREGRPEKIKSIGLDIHGHATRNVYGLTGPRMQRTARPHEIELIIELMGQNPALAMIPG